MATYSVSFYDVDPASIFSTAIGSTFTWTGPANPDGTATITDTEAGIEEFTLDDDDNGAETATADVTIGGSSSFGTSVDAELVWTLRDTVTGEIFEVIEFDVETGAAAGDYTLSEIPLVVGRLYEVIAYDTNPDVLAGAPAFDANDYINADQAVDGTGGADVINGAYVDGDGDQVNDGVSSGAGGNDDVVLAGGGNDDVTTGSGVDYIDAGEGNDTVSAGGSSDTVLGGTGDDSLLGNGGADSISGGAGADTIAGGGGGDNIDGGDGDDSILGNNGADSITGGIGADTIGGGGSNDTIDGGDGNDSLLGNAGTDSLIGGTGDDTLGGGTENDTLDGGIGSDSLVGGANDDVLIGGDGGDTIDGGDGADTITGDGGTISTEALNWSAEGTEGTDLAAGFTQTTGDIDVSVSFTDDGDNSPEFLVETVDAIYVEAGETFATNSSLRLFGDGDAATSTTTIDFAAATGAAVEDSVRNVSFRIADIDFGAANHQDVIVVTATDIDGNPVDVTITLPAASNETVNDDTITAGLAGETPADEAGSVLITVDGPVSQIEIAYSNALSGTQAIFVSDVIFETIPDATVSSDVIDGDAGDDVIDGQDGADTITGGAGADTMTGGTGDDVFVLADGSGADVITDFDIGDTDNDGSYNDQLDVTGLTDLGGNPVNAWDVTVGDDGFGNALLTFPNGETVILQGVPPAAVTGAQLLNAAGIPCFTSGTRIATPRGEIPVEALRPGDTVLTLDNGAQPILWTGHRHLSPRDLMAHPEHKPILIPKGVLGSVAPLFVSPLHGMFLDRSVLGEEVLVRAKHLAEAVGPVRVAHGKRRVCYHHLLFDRHQIIFANGALAESFYPGDHALEMYPARDVMRLEALIPGLGVAPVQRCYGPTARRFARRHEVVKGLDLRRPASPALAIAAE